jgi:hypothetical protein
MTAVQIVAALAQEDPPIVTTLRTIERDISAIKADSRRYLRADAFDTRIEVGTELLRHDLIARRATAQAMKNDGHEGAVWARVALLASEAKTALLEKAGLIDPSAFRLPPDESGKQAERVPGGDELRRVHGHHDPGSCASVSSRTRIRVRRLRGIRTCPPCKRIEQWQRRGTMNDDFASHGGPRDGSARHSPGHFASSDRGDDDGGDLTGV